MLVREVAERLAVAGSPVTTLCSRGLLRFVQIGNAIRSDLASVEAFIASGGVGKK